MAEKKPRGFVTMADARKAKADRESAEDKETKKAEDAKIAAEKKAEDAKIAAEKKAEDAKIAADQKEAAIIQKKAGK